MNAAIKGKLLISTLALFVSQTVFAAQAVPETNLSEKNDIMVVTTNRLGSSLWNSPTTIQVIDKQELDNSTNTSIADDLQDIPGVEITDNALAGRKQIRIRGEASSRVLILIDGQEVTYQRAGQDFGAGLLIDESSLERIEVVKGPYSVLYGSQAIGGVVNFITKGGISLLVVRLKPFIAQQPRDGMNLRRHGEMWVILITALMVAIPIKVIEIHPMAT
ncbi:MAG: TonB-dependent receptor plug domain-containing protein [Providencia heimbachae]|nr:TonB-dependent receptor plug domain-containing protein [Providencia heimbachae]